MWYDDLDSEEYERLNMDCDYPTYSSSSSEKTHNKKTSSDNEHYSSNSDDYTRFE